MYTTTAATSTTTTISDLLARSMDPAQTAITAQHRCIIIVIAVHTTAHRAEIAFETQLATRLAHGEIKQPART